MMEYGDRVQRPMVTNGMIWERTDGEENSFESIFHRHYQRIYGLLFRLTGSAAEADDLAQEVFLRLYNRPLAPEREHNLAAWLVRVALNLGYNALRSRRRRTGYETAAGRQTWVEDSPGDPVEEVARIEQQDRVRQTLAALPERQAQLLLLRHSGFSYPEIAAALGVAPGSIGSLLTRAERAFEAQWERVGGPGR